MTPRDSIFSGLKKQKTRRNLELPPLSQPFDPCSTCRHPISGFRVVLLAYRVLHIRSVSCWAAKSKSFVLFGLFGLNGGWLMRRNRVVGLHGRCEYGKASAGELGGDGCGVVWGGFGGGVGCGWLLCFVGRWGVWGEGWFGGGVLRCLGVRLVRGLAYGGVVGASLVAALGILVERPAVFLLCEEKAQSISAIDVAWSQSSSIKALDSSVERFWGW
ncbi:hypothetical protein Tco_1532115 [Tanacetum coccineum]